MKTPQISYQLERRLKILRASLWLVEQGAEIPIVNRLLTHRLAAIDKLHFFNELLQRIAKQFTSKELIS